ncbi:MAG: EAL domain-containing protein [Clostridia bacterium]|nr:EAL domain-containing protein [Clostridia bacterium]
MLIEHSESLRSLLDIITSHLRDGEHQTIIRLRMGAFENISRERSIDWYAEAAGAACDTIRGNYQQDIMLYDEKLHEQELYNERLIADVDEAIEKRQFRVFYQPKYEIQGERPRLVSAEALIRWQHPELGFVSPGAFIPLFEANGLILKLDNYVWEEAARQIHEWKEQYGIDLHISVNVSRKDLFEPNLTDRLLSIIEKHGVTIEDLYLEVTESAYSQDTSQMVKAVEKLRNAGFRIEMDDFGSGYSSLNMLCVMPIDALKIDMKFVRNIVATSTGYRMVELVVEMARALKVPAIVEGVEDEEQYQLIRKVGCDIVQGYYFSRPVDAENFEKLIQREAELQRDSQ